MTTDTEIQKLEIALAKANAKRRQELRDMAAPGVAYERQRKTTIATISNTQWLNNHTARFIRLARCAMPNATFALIHMGEKKEISESGVAEAFDIVETIKDTNADGPGLLGYNVPRYSLCSILGVDEVIYFDPDVDIVADVSMLASEVSESAQVGWCRSPVEPHGFGEAMDKCKLERPSVWANSGTLLLRGDFSEQYKAAAKMAIESGVDPRMVGNFAFSVMLQSGEVESEELPYRYGTIWWDATNYAKARVLHYCNDGGKRMRMSREAVAPRKYARMVSV